MSSNKCCLVYQEDDNILLTTEQLMFLRLRVNVQHRPLHYFPLVLVRIPAAIDEAVPVLLIHVREIGAAVISRPAGFLAEEDGADMRFGCHSRWTFSQHRISSCRSSAANFSESSRRSPSSSRPFSN